MYIYTLSALDISTQTDNFIDILLAQSFENDNAIAL